MTKSPRKKETYEKNLSFNAEFLCNIWNKLKEDIYLF